MFKRLLMTPAVLRGFFDAFLPEASRFIDFEMLEWGYAFDSSKDCLKGPV
jgi:hypothetical protein